jgi:hypothetical protein
MRAPECARAVHRLRPIGLVACWRARGPAGVLAFEGDRERTLAPGQRATLRIVRDGPRVIDVGAALAEAARSGAFVDAGHWHDAFDRALGDLDCC